MVVALLLVTFSVTMTALSARQEATALYGELERTARGTGQLLEPSAINWVLRGDISDLDHALRVVRAQDGVVDAYIMDDAGKVLADGTGRGPGRVALTGVRSADALAAGSAGVLRHGSVLDSIYPLETSGGRLGTLIIGYDLTEAERTIQGSRERHLLTGFAFAVVGLIMTWLLVRGVTRRLLLLTQAAQAAAGEQLPRLVRGLRAGGDPADLAPPALDIRSADEVGRLAGAFNSYRAVVVDMATDLTALANSSDARLRRAFDGSPIGMALTTPDGAMLEVNDALCTMLGRPRAELLGCTFAALAHPDDRPDRANTDRSWEPDAGQLHRRYLRPDGSTVWTLHADTVEREPDGTPGHIFAQLVDTTEQKRSEAEMAYLAFHDALTGLANRARLLQVLAHELEDARREDDQVAVILLDLDRFKLVNDSLGHAAGDELLQIVGLRLSAAVRLGDTVGRLGGDEFVVICRPNRHPGRRRGGGTADLGRAEQPGHDCRPDCPHLGQPRRRGRWRSEPAGGLAARCRHRGLRGEERRALLHRRVRRCAAPPGRDPAAARGGPAPGCRVW
jgi:PAS domain S-box-containing protein